MMEGVEIKEDDPLRKTPTIFGRELRSIPCFRNSFFYGFCGGIVGGLVTFLATSKGRLSSHIGFTSFWVTVFGYWFPCRYKYEIQQAKVQKWKEAVKKGIKLDENLNIDDEEEKKEDTGS